MPDNRRTTTRFDVSLPTSLTIGDASHELNMSNLSLGGAFIDYDERLSIGTRVEVSFSLPGTERPIVVGGAVRWVAPLGAGVQFDGLRAGEVWALNQFLKTLSGSAL